MSRLARWIARFVWGWLLWISRRPLARRLQRASLGLVPESRRNRFRASLVAQNRIARRYGLGVLTLSINLLLASIILTTAFLTALKLQESGLLSMPDTMREHILASGN